MGRTVIMRVRLPDNTSPVGAKLVATNQNGAGVRDWYGTTLEDGSFTWNNLDTGIFGDKYDFECRYIDSHSIE